MKLVALLIAMVLMASACGANSDAKEPAPAAESVTPSPTPTAEPPATVSQYASIVASIERDLSNQLAEMEDCNWIFGGELDQPGYIACRAGLLTTQYQAMTLRAKLNQAPDELGPPPPELEALIEETRDSATALAKSFRKAHNRGCADTDRGKCADLRFDAWSALGDLQTTLAAWGPYL